MIGLVLEGGGAKGAFHAGAAKAFQEMGITFDGYAGASVGAINGAVLCAENGVEKCLDMWNAVRSEDVLDSDTAIKLFVDVIKRGGVSTQKIMAFASKYIKESEVRKGGKDYGIITYSLSDLAPEYIYLENIPEGQLLEYIFASAHHPIFRLERLNNKVYIDGGIYDNLPVNLLVQKGYTTIYAVSTGSRMPKRPSIDTAVDVILINPSEDLGATVELSPQRVKFNIEMGYMDTMRHFKHYFGERFYIKNEPQPAFITLLKNESIFKFCLQEYADKTKDARQAFTLFLEEYAKMFGISKFKEYTISEFFEEIKAEFLKSGVQQSLSGASKLPVKDTIFRLLMQ